MGKLNVFLLALETKWLTQFRDNYRVPPANKRMHRMLYSCHLLRVDKPLSRKRWQLYSTR